MEKQSFLKNHADTVAIIGVNIGIAAFILTLCFSNIGAIASANARMDAANTRMDTIHMMFYELLKEMRQGK